MKNLVLLLTLESCSELQSFHFYKEWMKTFLKRRINRVVVENRIESLIHAAPIIMKITFVFPWDAPSLGEELKTVKLQKCSRTVQDTIFPFCVRVTILTP